VYERHLEKMCHCLVHDCKGFSAVVDLNQMREKTVQLADVVGFNEVCLDDVLDLLMSDKE
jgi:hypothetical protein